MSNDFEAQMQQWLAQVGGIVNLTIEEREEVNQAGADVLREKIAQAAPRNENRKLGKMKHLADSVTSGRLQGTKSDGNIAVGFKTDDVNHARIARFNNDGTAKMPNPKGLHFYDNALKEAEKDVNEAKRAKLAEIQERKAKT